MGLKLDRWVPVVAFVVVLSGCDLVAQMDERAYRDYHASRWQATVAAVVNEQASVELPGDPPTPRVCDGKIEPGYQRIVEQAAQSRDRWADLDRSSRITVQFVAEMLDVLVSRDTANIEKLAPQIDRYVAEQSTDRAAWEHQRVLIAESLDELREGWAEVWTGNDLDFDLATAAAGLRHTQFSDPAAERITALTHYHANEYDRLALVYLDYTPATSPNPVSHVPAGCDDLSEALKHLEAGLMVRYSMDRAIEQDVARIQELALIDLSRAEWEDIRIPEGRYARPRVTAAIARLKLLKYLDSLLMDCLDVLVTDVELRWRHVWPNHRLETNVFAYAGLATTGELASEALSGFTFRE